MPPALLIPVSVKVAQEILDLFVKVQILNREPNIQGVKLEWLKRLKDD
jgi:hypothetical protein